MLLRLLPIVLLAFALFTVAVPQATATCAGLESGGTCIGAYEDCELDDACQITTLYVCVGVYDGTDCTGVQKP